MIFRQRTQFVFLCLAVLLLTLTTKESLGWSNGGFSSAPSSPNFGTHDWIAFHALDYLALEDKQYLLDFNAIYLYGTELPDRPSTQTGIGDTGRHHLYYYSNQSLEDDVAAIRAQEYYSQTVLALKNGNLTGAALAAGIMTHYICDIGVFGHVMGSGTAWGNEVHHSDYEEYVNERTNSINDQFDVFLGSDGILVQMTAYQLTLGLGYDTTFDSSLAGRNATWMDSSYNWGSANFLERVGQSIRLSVNLVANALHSVSVEARGGFVSSDYGLFIKGLQVDNTSSVCVLTTNSYVNKLEFDQSSRVLNVTVSGGRGVSSWANMTFPSSLITMPINLLLDEKPAVYTVEQNSTHTTISVHYEGGVHRLSIYSVIPISEFPSNGVSLLLFLLIIVALMSSKLMVKKRSEYHP